MEGKLIVFKRLKKNFSNLIFDQVFVSFPAEIDFKFIVYQTMECYDICKITENNLSFFDSIWGEREKKSLEFVNPLSI